MRVRKYLEKFSLSLVLRGEDHDSSKFSDEEFPAHVAAMETFDDYKYDPNQAAKPPCAAAVHHHKCNRHHPEHFADGIEGMNLIDILEMLADWKSATLNNPNNLGDIISSIEIATKKYNLSPQLVKILANTVDDYDLNNR
jgi:hypothetical protein